MRSVAIPGLLALLGGAACTAAQVLTATVNACPVQGTTTEDVTTTVTVNAAGSTLTSGTGTFSNGAAGRSGTILTGTLTTVPAGQAGGSKTLTYTYTSGGTVSSVAVSVSVPTPTHASTTASSVASASASSAPYSNVTNSTDNYLDWTTYTANGVNLGCWLELEYSCYEVWWASFNTTATDEWDFCEQLGDQCEAVMIEHYTNFMNESVIDSLAAVGVNTLRIPTTYAAWVDVPGSQLYHGNQSTYLKKIANYAIETYGMYVAIDFHSLPGGVNYLDIGEAYEHDYWFFNATNLQYSLDAVSAVLEFFDETGHVDYFTLEPINEAADNLTEFGTCAGLSTAGFDYVAAYINLVLEMVEAFNAQIPVMFQVCFCTPADWSSTVNASANLVFDEHVYYFEDAGVYAQYADDTICGQAEGLATGSDFPVFIGEWSLQVTYNNTFDLRATLFNTQRYAWEAYTQGGAFWSAVHYGNATVSGEGDQEDYWSYLGLIEAGVITSPTNTSYC